MSTATMPARLRLRGRKKSPGDGGGDIEVKRARRMKLLRAGVVAAMLLAIFATLATVFAGSAFAQEQKGNEYSLYKLSSATSAYFGNAQSPESETGELGEGWAVMTSNPGNGGALLGYPDSNKNLVLKWLTSQLSGSSVTYNYESFTAGKILTDGGATGDNAALLNYAYFGAALNQLGLDSTSTSLSLGITNLIGGGLMLFFFVMAAAVDLVFWALLSLMKLLNPFALFYTGVAAVNPQIADALGGSPIQQDVEVLGVTFPHPLYGLANFIGGWYAQLYSISLALIPVFIAVLVVTLLFFRKANAGGKVKRLLTRLVFITVGVPILGGLYTGSLNALLDTVGNSGGSMGASKVVLSTYVDFERWATVNRLYVPKAGENNSDCTAIITWQGSRSEPDGRARAGLRNTALCINTTTGAYGNVGQITTAGQKNSATGNWSYTSAGDSASAGPDGSSEAVPNTIGLLLRYMDGSHVSASDFETGYQAKLTADMNDDPSVRKQAKFWFVDYTDVGKLKDAHPGNAPAEEWDDHPGNPVLALAPNRGLKVDVNSYPDFSSYFSSYGGTRSVCNYDVIGNGRDCNMSAMAMYNYLNTSFGSKSMTVYSSERSSSGAIREQHNSVNQIGTGLMGFLYWFNSIVMLATFVIVGAFYAIAMVIGNLKRSIQAITSIPFAMLGAVNSIAKVIVYAVAMIVELMGTIFLYIVMQEIMMSLPQIIEMPLANIMSGTGGTAVGVAAILAGGGWLSMAVLVFSTLFMIWFTMIALKIRKGFISGMNEAVTKVVEKFADSQVAPPSMSGPSMAGALAGGAATGAGMAAAGRMMAGGGKGPGSSTASGPSGISAGGSSAGGLMGAIGAGDGPNALGGGSGGPDDQGGPGGEGGEGGAGVDGQQVDEDGRPIDVDDRGNPISASGEDPGASGAVAGSDDQDRDTAAAVEARGGLSTGDDASDDQQGQQGGTAGVVAGSDDPGDREDQKGVFAGLPASETMDPNTKASTAEEITAEKDAAREEQAKAGGKAVVGGAEAAAGAYTGNAEMTQDGAQRAADGVQGVQDGQQKIAAVNDKVGSDGSAGEVDGKSGGAQAGTGQKVDPKDAAAAGAAAGLVGGAAASTPKKGLPTGGQSPKPGPQGQRPAQAPQGQRPAAQRPAQAPQQRPTGGGQRPAAPQPQRQAPSVRQAPTPQQRPSGGQQRGGQTNVNVQVGGSQTFKDQRGNGGGVRAQAQRAAQQAKEFAKTPQGQMIIAQGVQNAAQARQQRRGRGQERI